MTVVSVLLNLDQDAVGGLIAQLRDLDGEITGGERWRKPHVDLIQAGIPQYGTEQPRTIHELTGAVSQ